MKINANELPSTIFVVYRDCPPQLQVEVRETAIGDTYKIIIPNGEVHQWKLVGVYPRHWDKVTCNGKQVTCLKCSTGPILGVFSNGKRCDSCQKYATDLEAQQAVVKAFKL